jgi:hypothetical protein
MSARSITADDLSKLEWIELTAEGLARVDWTGEGTGWWRIVAEIDCQSCGAHQAVDSDPVNDKSIATTLTIKLFNQAGWRVDERAGVICGACARV